MKQRDLFLASEGNAYHRRNIASFSTETSKAKADRVVGTIVGLGVKPESILEIGCGHGWRLDQLFTWSGARCVGVDPSLEAISDGRERYAAVTFARGTADQLDFLTDGEFELVILGCCLYVCDREDLFRIAAAVDRVLANRGRLVVEDFCPPYPYKTGYRHHPAITTYKMDHAQMFLWNPAYTLVSHRVFDATGDVNNWVGVSVLAKALTPAFPRMRGSMSPRETGPAR